MCVCSARVCIPSFPICSRSPFLFLFADATFHSYALIPTPFLARITQFDKFRFICSMVLSCFFLYALYTNGGISVICVIVYLTYYTFIHFLRDSVCPKRVPRKYWGEAPTAPPIPSSAPSTAPASRRNEDI